MIAADVELGGPRDCAGCRRLGAAAGPENQLTGLPNLDTRLLSRNNLQTTRLFALCVTNNPAVDSSEFV